MGTEKVKNKIKKFKFIQAILSCGLNWDVAISCQL